MNRQPFGTPPRWWAPKLSPRWVRLTRRYRRRKLMRQQELSDVVVHDLDNLRKVVDAGHGVLVTPNHSAHYDSAALYMAADRLNVPLYMMAAWQVFAMSGRLESWAMQRLGIFSIDRESTDRQAFKQAVNILQKERYPLVIFPEGDIYHVNDRVTPFREGAAAIALSAAKRAQRPVVAVPTGYQVFLPRRPDAAVRKGDDGVGATFVPAPATFAPAGRTHSPLCRGRLGVEGT